MRQTNKFTESCVLYMALVSEQSSNAVHSKHFGVNVHVFKKNTILQLLM